MDEAKDICIHGSDIQEWCEHCEIDSLNNDKAELLEALKKFSEWEQYPSMGEIFRKYNMDGVAQRAINKAEGK